MPNKVLEAPGWILILEVTVGNKDKVANIEGWCAPAETVDPAGKSWAVMDPDPDSPWSGWRVGLCERPGACLECQV